MAKRRSKNERAVESSIADLDQGMKMLKMHYEQFFLGIERIEPMTQRKTFRAAVLAMKGKNIENTSQKLRIDNIWSKLLSYERLWERTKREMEEGRHSRDRFRARRRSQNNDEINNKEEESKAEEIENKEEVFDLSEDIAAFGGLNSEAIQEALKADGVKIGVVDKASFKKPDIKWDISGVKAPEIHGAIEKKPFKGSGLTGTKSRGRAGKIEIKRDYLMGRKVRDIPDAGSGGVSNTVYPKQKAEVERIKKQTLSAHGAEDRRRVSRPFYEGISPGERSLSGEGSHFSPKPAPLQGRASSGGLTDEKVDRIYRALIAAKKKCGENISGISREGLGRSLRKQLPHIKQKNSGKKVEFKVVIRNGKAYLEAVA